MEHRMEQHTKTFLRGTLPNWFSVILLAVIGFMGQRAIAEFDSLRNHLQETRERVIATEAQIKSIEAALVDLKASQRDILRELKAVNVNLKEK